MFCRGWSVQAFRRSGSSGWGWYNKALEAKNKETCAMRPYDAVLSTPAVDRPLIYMDFSIDEEPAGRLVIELANDIVPRTAENFYRLCTEEHPFSYKNTIVNRLRSDVYLSIGDAKEAGGHSSFDEQYFEDENFALQFSEPGILGMTNSGVHTNGSQFFITYRPMPHLNGRNVAFGKVVQGMDTMEKINRVYTAREKPLVDIKIKDCGRV